MSQGSTSPKVDQGTGGASAWLVDGTGGTFPISGTVAATQSGTWTVQPGNTANSTAWLVTGTGGTFPVTGTVTSTTSYVSITATGGTFASSGNNTLITPSNSLRISYLSLSAAAANTAAVLCIVKFTTGGSTLYEVQLLPGAIWAHHPAAGLHYVTGTAGQALVVNLDSAQTVYWSLEYADV